MRWIILSLLSLCFCSCGKKSTPVDPPTDTPMPADAPKLELTALYQFWDTTLNEHIYTYGDGELANWRRNQAFSAKPTVGYVATKPYPGTVQLYRAYCRDRRHYFYLKQPAGATDIERMEDFHVYVWTAPGDGRVPVHACFLPDDKDACFSQDLNRIKDYVDGTLKGIGKQRKLVENYFYVYPTGSAGGTPPQPTRPITPSATPPKPGSPNNPTTGGPGGGGGVATLWKAKFDEAPVLSADGKMVLAYQWSDELNGNVIRVWDTQTGSLISTVGDGKIKIEKFGISPDKSQVAVASTELRTMTLWDIRSGRLQKTYKMSPMHDGFSPIPFVTYSADGKSVLTAFGQKFLRIDIATGQERILVDKVDMFSAAYCPKKHLFVDLIVVPNKANALRIFDLASGEVPKMIYGAEEDNLSAHVTVSGDGTTVSVTATYPVGNGRRDAVYLYDVATGRLKAKIPFAVQGDPDPMLHEVRLSPDGNRVFICGSFKRGDKAGYLRVLADGTGQIIRTIGGEEPIRTQMSPFASNGTTAVAFSDNGIRIYDAKSDTEQPR